MMVLISFCCEPEITYWTSQGLTVRVSPWGLEEKDVGLGQILLVVLVVARVRATIASRSRTILIQ